jgi:hypothetical protein
MPEPTGTQNSCQLKHKRQYKPSSAVKRISMRKVQDAQQICKNITVVYTAGAHLVCACMCDARHASSCSCHTSSPAPRPLPVPCQNHPVAAPAIRARARCSQLKSHVTQCTCWCAPRQLSLHGVAVLQVAAPAGRPVLLIAAYQRLGPSSIHQAQREQRTAAGRRAGRRTKPAKVRQGRQHATACSHLQHGASANTTNTCTVLLHTHTTSNPSKA